MKYFSLIPAVLALAVGTLASPTPGGDSLVTKRDATSELQSLYSEVKQYRAAIGTYT